MEFLKKYGLIILMIITFLSFINGCGLSSRLSKQTKQLEGTTARIDSLGNEIKLLKEKTVSSDEMINIVKGTTQTKPVNITIKK